MKLAVPCVVVALAAGSASATIISSIASSLGATYHAGARPTTGIYGTTSNGSGWGYMASPYSNYSYIATGSSNSNGDLPDFHWVQTLAPYSGSPGAGILWSFGASRKAVFLDPSIDHDPFFEESFETTLYGSNDGGTTWILGTITDVYELGFDALALPDNGSQRWVFPQPVNLVAGLAGLFQGTYAYYDGDNEVDCVSMKPQANPGTIPLPSAGLLGLGGLGVVGTRRARRLV